MIKLCKFLNNIFYIFLAMLICNLSVNAESDYIRGLLGVEETLHLNIVNKLQAIADNDAIKLSKVIPNNYFKDNGFNSFVYYATSDADSLEIISFDYKNPDFDNCFDESSTSFCVLEINPRKIKYTYDNRILEECFLNYLDAPNEIQKYEILVKDGVFIDKRLMSTNEQVAKETPIRECEFDDLGKLSFCKLYSKESKEFLGTEVLEKNPNQKYIDIPYKYRKFSPEGLLQEEFTYSTNRRVYYDEQGNIVAGYISNKDRFMYFNQKYPNLYIDTRFVRDVEGRVVKELNYDCNNKLLRSYIAKYTDDNASEILVIDHVSGVQWKIIPITKDSAIDHPFDIRI